VSHPEAGATLGSRSWLVFLARAVIAIVIAVAITFSADHSARLGFLTFGAFAILSGIVVAIGGLTDGHGRTPAIVQGGVSVIAGILSLALSGSEVAVLLFLISSWAAVTGFAELYRGLRSRRRTPLAREWVFAGGLTAVLAIAALVIPADLSESFVGPDNVERSLTASVVLVGIFGAYAAILGVYFVIAALSTRWSTTAVPEGNR
jgi:uncharacterized membrane protein HdeD (DUF308 family)